MKTIVSTFAFVLLTGSLASSAFAQGAALSGIQGTAEKMADKVQNKIMAGPVDKQERVAPGKIDKDASKEFKKTNSGLKYRILRKSKKTKPKASDTVVAHYKGWLDSKKIFDSSYRRGEPIPFPLKGVIAGWTEGLQLIGAGGMIELDIPHELAYGVRGRPGIPPRARLHFIVELVSIK